MAITIQQIKKKNSTSQIIEVFVRDTTTGKGVIGLAVGSVFIRAWANGLAGASATANPVVNAVNDVWATNGWKEVDATNLAGYYQYSIPNALLQSNANMVFIAFRFTGANIGDVLYQISITPVDLFTGVQASPEGLAQLLVEGFDLLYVARYCAAIIAGQTAGAETALTQFKAFGNNAINRVESQSADQKNRTSVNFL